LEAFSADPGGLWLWAGGLAGALLTSIYTFRMIFLVFFGPRERRSTGGPAPPSRPLAVLAFLSLAGGLVETPRYLGT